MMNSKTVTVWKRAIRASGAAVRVTRIGAGKWQEMEISGPDAERVVRALEVRGFRRTGLATIDGIVVSL